MRIWMQFSSIQSLSRVRFFMTLWTAAHQASLSITDSRSSPKPMSIESVMPSSHLILCCPLLLLPSIFPSIRVFSKESALLIRWPKYWSLASASVLPINSQDWFPLGWTGWISLQSKGLSRVFSNNTVQKHRFQCSALFIVQFSHLYMTTGKTIALTRWTFAGKVIFLLFNMLCRFVIVFLPRNNLSYKNNTIIITLLVFRYVSQWNFGLVNRTTTHDVCHQFLHLYLILQVDWPFPLHHQFGTES